MKKIAIVSLRSDKLEAYAAARASGGDQVVWCDLAEAEEAAEIVFSAEDPRIETDGRTIKISRQVTVVGREASNVEIHDTGKAGKRSKTS